MIKYTTPTISLTVEGVDITAHNIYVSVEQGSISIVKSGSDLILEYSDNNTNIIVSLSQEESAMFDHGERASIQVNWITSAGVRSATEIKTIRVFENLLDKVVAYGD